VAFSSSRLTKLGFIHAPDFARLTARRLLLAEFYNEPLNLGTLGMELFAFIINDLAEGTRVLRA
jgi:hypothetical protein